MAEETIRPGSWVGDSVEEFKKLPMWGKLAIGGTLVAIVGIALYERNKASMATVGSSLASPGVSSAALEPNTVAGGMQSPFGQVPNASGNGSIPLVPYGDTPIMDGLGNLIGWQQPPTLPVTPSPISGTPNGSQYPGGNSHGLLGVPAPTVQSTGHTTAPTMPRLTTYIVNRGDNLSTIAAREHVNGGWQALYNANKSVVGSNPNLIKPGQRLVIPR